MTVQYKQFAEAKQATQNKS